MSGPNMSSHRRPRRLWTISLRGLLIIVLVSGAAFGWIGSKRYQSQRQSAAVATLNELARMRYARYSNGRPKLSREVSVITYESGPAELRAPRGKWLPGWLRNFTGEECFHRVVEVNLSGSLLHDSDLSNLQGVSTLESLNLEGTEVGENLAPYLAPLTRLRHLCLGETNITAETLAKLQSQTSLRELELWNNDFGDEILASLQPMIRLRRINLCGTRITTEGVAELQRALPDCRIWWDETEAFRLINACPQPFDVDDPNPTAIVRAVNHLLSLGKDRAVDSLREYVRIAPQESFDHKHSYDQQRLCTLLPLLFNRKHAQQGIPDNPLPPNFLFVLNRMGIAVPPAATVNEWPNFDITVEGDIPFHTIPRLARFGPAFPERGYLVEWAAANCTFHSRPLHPEDNPFVAADRLAKKLKKDETGANLYDVREYLHQQAQRMTGDLGYVQISHLKIRWSDERQKYVEQEAT